MRVLSYSCCLWLVACALNPVQQAVDAGGASDSMDTGQGPPGDTDAGGADAADGTGGPPVAACPGIDPDAPGHPIYDHRVQRADSEDGIRFTKDDTVLLEHASVPDAVVREDGETWVYYVNGESGQHGVFIARLEDDGLLHPFDCVRIDGEFNGNAVDPDVVRLDDGRYRLFYFEGWFVGPKPPPGEDPAHPFFQAISDDGIHFTVESKIFETEDGGTDPTGAALGDGSWLVAIAHKDNTWLAKSTDGVEYAFTDVLLPQGIPELHAFADGIVRLYMSSLSGMKVWSSEDQGASWVEEASTNIMGADPSLVREADGGYAMYYKTFEPGSQEPRDPPRP